MRHLACIVPFELHNSPVRWYYRHHFIDEETEAQRRSGTCLGPHSESVAERDFEPLNLKKKTWGFGFLC